MAIALDEKVIPVKKQLFYQFFYCVSADRLRRLSQSSD